MGGVPATRAASRCLGLLLFGLLAASPAAAFDAFDGRLQAHGFYEMQLRAMNADYSEDWDVVQWYHVFNLEVELDLIDESVGIFDLLSAYIRAEVRYDCIYSSGCGMFRSMNAYGDRSKSLPRRLSNAEQYQAAGEIHIRNNGRVTGATTDPVPISEVAGFNNIADTEGQIVPRSAIPCAPGSKEGVNCFPDGTNWIQPFDYIFEEFSEYRFSMVNVSGGANAGRQILIMGPWLPKNEIPSTTALMADRVNPFDNSRYNPVLVETLGLLGEGRREGNGARPFRPIPIYAEDRSKPGPEGVEAIVYANWQDVNSPYKRVTVQTQFNHGDTRF